jgi:hypothetical protein
MTTIQTAIDLHRQGRLVEAKAQYKSLLAKHPRQFESFTCLEPSSVEPIGRPNAAKAALATR